MRYVYRGRTVEIRPPVEEPPQGASGAMPMGPGHAGHEHGVQEPGGQGGVRRYTLLIDGQEIEVEEDENGVLSHDFMFRRFSNVHELAEELIRQWGTSIPDRSQMTGHMHHHDG